MPDKAQKGQKRLPSTAWKKGQSGNPAGCPTGSRHKATLAVQTLLDGEAEGLTRKAIELALEGDMTALRLCLERICPVPKDRPVRVALPEVKGVSDLPGITAALLAATAEGRLTPTEAEGVAKLVEAHRKAIEVADIEARLSKLETERS